MFRLQRYHGPCYTELMQLNPYIFRGYDIRGVVGQDIDEETFYLLGRGYATFLTERRIKLCPVGRDNRKSSQSLSKQFIRGLNDGGIDTIDIGLSLSQIVYFSSYHFLTKACAMITASHNPKEFNGLKLGIGYSNTMSGSEIQELRKIIESGRFSIGYGESQSKNIFPYYQKHLLKYFKLNKKWRIVVDTLNNSSGRFYPQLFRKAGCRIITQNERMNGNFPNGTDPTDINVLNKLGKAVLREKADIGFAFDADGDRMAVVDENGKLHWMDIVVTLFAIDVLERLPNATIIYNNLCSKAVPDTIKKLGGNPLMWKTGHSFIKSKILETKAMLGGELSGHIFFMDNYFGHDDAAYACLRLLSFLENHGESLSEAASSIETHIGSPEIKLGVPDEIKFDLVEKELKHDLVTAWPDAKVNVLDGIRLDTDDLMAVVRASQNGPYITIRFEGKNERIYNEVRDRLNQILGKYSIINWIDNINAYALEK
ncbi:MAG: Phosphomannomutase [Microgenomates group bacterium GW2011_GWC1_44_37]|uniref:Phosphomannomutase n=1 Tax=Candidatus Collierbacteria bacterium GW2011_GWB2_44_22 TaxID=1618387 RepID=A0A0G1HY10_9BACT|nr:MAG: Phosphomannomutase [Candidatus Collierbacteria bacterium GW2011_GWA2_44_13]KKT51021.1 MAG: Phosphomannomutase [Candidatus Collierbacteria bacterium GW2011_GWB1_44_197]KKT51498.1 MAG: Phosphomannomutase [Candidatus Collierbacteria bacterium GW2011_GWB2_44_22]KKT62235.1 MAG: Phosphomannomutase [Candidatus Collierbacteria bacterium GW2011_GWD1_44_27]KKT66776.1 MAG: Phosphomannomutase [Candidatus Collierbacteria bacterium GW2011_GWC2_44_30]KKT69061.1 MAG: Phosphomannomutase [Microgenomates